MYKPPGRHCWLNGPKLLQFSSSDATNTRTIRRVSPGACCSGGIQTQQHIDCVFNLVLIGQNHIGNCCSCVTVLRDRLRSQTPQEEHVPVI